MRKNKQERVRARESNCEGGQEKESEKESERVSARERLNEKENKTESGSEKARESRRKKMKGVGGKIERENLTKRKSKLFIVYIIHLHLFGYKLTDAPHQHKTRLSYSTRKSVHRGLKNLLNTLVENTSS